MTNTKKFWPLFPCFHISRSSLRHYHKHITEAKTGQCLKYKFISPTLYIWSVGLVSHHRDVITLFWPHSLYMSQRFCFWKTCLYVHCFQFSWSTSNVWRRKVFEAFKSVFMTYSNWPSAGLLFFPWNVSKYWDNDSFYVINFNIQLSRNQPAMGITTSWQKTTWLLPSLQRTN